VLVGVSLRRAARAGHTEEHLDELARLVDTTRTEVVGRLKQQLDAPSANLLLGRGKVAELAGLVRTLGATLVVFDDDLSPSQGRNLERALECRVMDRTEVILDIFATRAKSREAKLQVELAQLGYLLPRLARMWVHLSRVRGGIGLRGPGETQIETDRRMIRRRISRLKRELLAARRHRAVLRHARRHVTTLALVGYTNAGKSSLLKALTGADALIDDRLFATLDTLTRETDVQPGVRIRVVDTVGFIRKLPHHLVASFRATLEEAEKADVLVHVIDASHPDWEQQLAVVDGVLADLDEGRKPLVHVFNKMDLVTEPGVLRARAASQYPNPVFVSAVGGEVAQLVALLRRLAVPAAKLA
jgi:GTP-binding protein HflX